MPREYHNRLGKYGISPNRVKELEAFCQQYDEKKEKLNNLYTASFVAPEVSVMGGTSGNPTENKAFLALKWQEDIDLIDRCIAEACSLDIGLIEKLTESVTKRLGYGKLGIVPCGRNYFNLCKRRFFILLDEMKK